MRKPLKVITLLFAAALMAAMMAVPAFATVYYQDTDVAAYYFVSTTHTEEILIL